MLTDHLLLWRLWREWIGLYAPFVDHVRGALPELRLGDMATGELRGYVLNIGKYGPLTLGELAIHLFIMSEQP